LNELAGVRSWFFGKRMLFIFCLGVYARLLVLFHYKSPYFCDILKILWFYITSSMLILFDELGSCQQKERVIWYFTTYTSVIVSQIVKIDFLYRRKLNYTRRKFTSEGCSSSAAIFCEAGAFYLSLWVHFGIYVWR
jgi:hypothetical protein